MHGYDTYDIVWRQYYPAIARFQTVDPEAEKFYYISPYTMCNNNMVLNTDPDGRIFETLWDVYNVATGVVSLAKNVASGNVEDAVLDAVGIVADVAAVVAPGIPGGAGAAIKAYRAGDKVVDAVKTADKVSDVKKTYQTYTKPPKNPADGVYNGKTSGKGTPEQNVTKRDKNHHMNKTHGPAKLDKSSSNPDAITGREQQNIDNSGGSKSKGGTSGNQRNSVDPNNKERVQRTQKAAKKEFGN